MANVDYKLIDLVYDNPEEMKSHSAFNIDMLFRGYLMELKRDIEVFESPHAQKIEEIHEMIAHAKEYKKKIETILFH